MYGHEKLIEMRKAGMKPSGLVFIDDQPSVIAKDWHNPGEKYAQVWRPDSPTICTHGDVIQMLDMRFLVGLKVSVESENLTRAKALFEKAKASGAAVVAGSHSILTKGLRDSIVVKTGWCEIWRKELAEA